MGILQIGTKALQANQVALQTTGNNIANVNTEGYSRQRTILSTVEGQFSGGGYIGKGVDVLTIERSYSEFLTRQAATTAATSASDVIRANKLTQLEGIFEGGSSGLGAAINDMLNAFSDVASAPTDLTARTVAMTRVDETAARLRATDQRLDDLQTSLSEELTQKLNAANSAAQSIATLNGKISAALSSGHNPNDLLDQRDQIIRELNQYIQTSPVNNGDGSISLYVGGSQGLVVGTRAYTLQKAPNEFGDALSVNIEVKTAVSTVALAPELMGGGEISGIAKFQNSDMLEARNLLGRLTLGLTTSMNDQHKLGLDMDGNRGGNIFTQASFNQFNVLIPTQQPNSSTAIRLNQGTAQLSLAINDPTAFSASDYVLTFSSASTGVITRLSDNQQSTFDFGATDPVSLDGIDISMPSGVPALGDRFLIKPFNNIASEVYREFSLPRSLAVATPVVATLGSANTGSLQVGSLKATARPAGFTPPPSPTAPATTGGGVQLTFASGPPPGYIVSGTATVPESYAQLMIDVPSTPAYVAGTTVVPYSPNQAISIDGWEITLSGSAGVGDTVRIGNALDTQYGGFYKRNAGNASAIMDLRDVAMFDGAVLTDGYASLMAQVGIRVQSAEYTATVSSSIAASIEQERQGVSGVNLDEEAAKLIQYQQAYQASAKMIQIAQSIFDSLIQSLSR